MNENNKYIGIDEFNKQLSGYEQYILTLEYSSCGNSNLVSIDFLEPQDRFAINCAKRRRLRELYPDKEIRRKIIKDILHPKNFKKNFKSEESAIEFAETFCESCEPLFKGFEILGIRNIEVY